MNIGDLIIVLSLGGVMGIGAVRDLRSGRIPVWLLAAGAVGVASGVLLSDSLMLRERLIGLLPGVMLFAVGMLWHLIGTGDSVLILLAGFGLGFRGLCFFLMVSLLCLLPVALLLVVIRKVGRKALMPFYPFAAVGLTVSLLLGVVP